MSKGYSPKWLQEWAAQDPERKFTDYTNPPTPAQEKITSSMAQEKDTAKLARDFEEAWSWTWPDGPELLTEHKFHPVRKWAFDYAHPATKVAIELEGGIWTGGRHTNGAGFTGDCAKYNEAALLGWTVFRIPTGGVDPALLERIGKLIEQRIAATDIPF